MKQVIVLLSLLTATLFSQEVDITRGQFWGRVTIAPQFDNGFSAILSASMRDNFSITKEVNGVEKPASVQGNWLNELYLGAGWKKKVGKRSLYSTQLLYRPQFWYPNSTDNAYLRHTIMSNNNLYNSFNRFKFHQRISLWGLFKTADEELEYNNELIVRYLFGPELKLGKRITLSVKGEPFFKVTADETDIDGTELFNRFYVWSGVDFSPTKGVKLTLNYVNMNIFQTEQKSVTDHTIYAHVTFAPQWKSK